MTPALTRQLQLHHARSVIRKPIISEKAYANYERNVYAFDVRPDANKIEIKNSIEKIFEVKVATVRTMNRRGKRSRNRRTGHWNSRPDRKFAIVTLVAGDKIEIFEGQ